MAANPAADQASSSPQAQAGGGGSKLVSLISIVNLVVTLGMLGVLFLSFQKEKKQQSLQDINAQAPVEEGAEHEGGEKSEKPKEGGEKAEKKEGKEGEHKEGKEGKEGEKKKLPEYGKMVTLEQFTVNLLTPGSLMPKYVRVNISIEVPNSDVEEEVTAKLPMVRNVIIDLFNSKRPSDLSTAENRDYLKEEIQTTLDGFLISGKIKGVYFTSFSLSG